MPRPFKKQNFRHHLEARLDELASQTEEIRHQVVERAPGVRDQLIEMLPDKEQLLDLRDELFERLPDSVAEKLPEKVKPKKRSKFKRVALLGAMTGAGAAAFAAMRNRTSTPPPPREPFPAPVTPADLPTSPKPSTMPDQRA